MRDMIMAAAKDTIDVARKTIEEVKKAQIDIPWKTFSIFGVAIIAILCIDLLIAKLFVSIAFLLPAIFGILVVAVLFLILLVINGLLITFAFKLNEKVIGLN